MRPHGPRILVPALFLAAFLAAACGEDGGNGGSDTPRTVTGDTNCLVTFGVTNAVDLEILDANIDYRRTRGTFAGDRSSVCEPLVPGSLISTTHSPDRTVLNLSLLAAERSLHGPRDLVRCRFVGEARPRAKDFSIAVVSYEPARPALSATKIACSITDGIPTSSTSTTSTLPTCTDGCGGGEECFEGKCAGPDDYELVFTLADEVNLGSLLIQVYHDCALGSMVGEADRVDCEIAPFNAFANFNNMITDEVACGASVPGFDPTPQFVAGIISTTGVETPADLFTCRFRSAGRR